MFNQNEEYENFIKYSSPDKRGKYPTDVSGVRI